MTTRALAFAVLLLIEPALVAQGKPYAFVEREPVTVLEKAIEKVLPCVVKVHGASGLATIEAYSSGVLVSDKGHVLVIDLVMMQKGSTKVVLADGSVHPAQLLESNDKLGVRLLKIEDLVTPTPFVTPAKRSDWKNGTLVFSLGNCFRLAEFSEKLSVTFGVLTGRARTGLRYKLQDLDYDGELLIVDAANNPGHEGGGLFTRSGEWIGINAKVVESTETNTQLSAAIPVWELRPFLDRVLHGKPEAEPDPNAAARVAGFHGITLFDKGGRTSPPAYVEKVAPNSPGAVAGLKPDDLIVRIGENAIRTCREFRHFMARVGPGEKAVITFKRGGDVQRLELELVDAKR